MTTLTVVNAAGRAFTVRVVGDKAEIFDATYPAFGPLGQFVASYYLRSLEGVTTGLAMHGGIPEWTLTAENVREILACRRTVDDLRAGGYFVLVLSPDELSGVDIEEVVATRAFDAIEDLRDQTDARTLSTDGESEDSMYDDDETNHSEACEPDCGSNHF